MIKIITIEREDGKGGPAIAQKLSDRSLRERFDADRMLGATRLATIPPMFLMKKNETGRGPIAAH